MAVMFPPTVAEGTPSKAEKKLFRQLRLELNDEWQVLHSLGLSRHGRKQWAEIDFVLIGPPAVFCLEVKGGRVRREDSRWIFTDGTDREGAKNEGPWAQAGGASSALYNWLKEADRRFATVPVCFAVCMPDIKFTQTGPDIDLDLLYDERDNDSPFDAFIDRIVPKWEARLGRTFTPIDVSVRNAIQAKLRPDFDARPSILSVITNAEGDMIRLTAQQTSTFNAMVENDHLIVNGAAGTGKTVLAKLEAERLAGTGARVLLTCISPRLAKQVRSELPDPIEVKDMHLLMRTIVHEAGLDSRIPNDASKADIKQLFIPQLCADALISDLVDTRFDAIVIDEAQDLLNQLHVDVLDALLANGLASGIWRVFIDPLQNVFESVETDSVARLRNYYPALLRLSLNCRNTSPIAVVTSLLAEVDLGETLEAEGPEVEWIYYRDAGDRARQIARAINRLLSGGVARSDIVLLGKDALDRSGLAGNSLPGLSYPVTSVDRSDGIRYSSIADFKGLEARAVLMVGVDDLDATGAAELVYVGTSRARAWLTVVLPQSAEEDVKKRGATLGQRLADAEDGLS